MSKCNQPCDDCGSSDAKAYYADHSYCFSCKKRVFFKEDIELNTYFPRLETVTNDIAKYPVTLSGNFNKAALSILMRAGITKEIRESYRLGFVEDEEIELPSRDTVRLRNRIIIPVAEGLYQARATDDSIPKYYTVGRKQQVTLTQEWPRPHIVVLVEDVFSAIRLHNIGYNVIPLLGTSLYEQTLLQIVKKYGTVIIWLDDDKPGIRAASSIERKVNLVVDKVFKVRAKEPKLCSDQEIQNILDPLVYRSPDV